MSIRDIYVEIGRDRYAELLGMVVQTRLADQPLPFDSFSHMLAGVLVDKGTEPPDGNLWKVANRLKARGHPLLTVFRGITDATPVLFKTPSVRYRQNMYPLARPCPLGALVEIVRGLTTSLRDSMVFPWEWFFEWEDDILRFVPSLKHRFACTVYVAKRCELGVETTSEAFTCFHIDDVTTKIHAIFDQLADALEEVPVEFAGFLEATRANVTVHVYDLVPQAFRVQNLERNYAEWVAKSCE